MAIITSHGAQHNLKADQQLLFIYLSKLCIGLYIYSDFANRDWCDCSNRFEPVFSPQGNFQWIQKPAMYFEYAHYDKLRRLKTATHLDKILKCSKVWQLFFWDMHYWWCHGPGWISWSLSKLSPSSYYLLGPIFRPGSSFGLMVRSMPKLNLANM